MADDMTGGCYRVTGGPYDVFVCHCRDCQRQSSSAFGMSLAVPPDAFAIVAGTPKTFAIVADSGRRKTCAFCADCGSRIYHRTVRGVSIKAGTLDDTSGLRPRAHFWTKRKQPWVPIPDGTRCFADDG